MKLSTRRWADVECRGLESEAAPLSNTARLIYRFSSVPSRLGAAACARCGEFPLRSDVRTPLAENGSETLKITIAPREEQRAVPGRPIKEFREIFGL